MQSCKILGSAEYSPVAAVGVEEATKGEFYSGTETATDNDMYPDRWRPPSARLSVLPFLQGPRTLRRRSGTILNFTPAFDN